MPPRTRDDADAATSSSSPKLLATDGPLEKALRRNMARGGGDAIELSETLSFEFEASNLALANDDGDEATPMEQPAGALRSWRPPAAVRTNTSCVILQCCALGALLALTLLFSDASDRGDVYHVNWTVMSANDTRSPRTPASAPATIPLVGGTPPTPPATGTPPAPPPNALASALVYCPAWAPALGFAGASIALIMSSLGSAYGTGKAGMGISHIGVEKPELVMKSIIPVVMAGVLGIYGLIIAVIVADGVKPFSASGGTRHSDYSAYSGFAHLSAGLCCGLSGVAAGIAIGIVGDAGVRAVALQPRVYIGMVLILIFAEALGLYGLIVGLILSARTSSDCGPDTA